MVFFNLNDTSNILSNQYSHYGKANGLIFAHKLKLPVSNYGWICSSINDYIDLPDSENKYLCRPDAPKGMGNKLPRGKDLTSTEIISFMKEIKSISEDGIVLIFQHPTLESCGHYIPRYQSTGGATVVINKKRDVTIEFVGPGFDAGDLTRGKTVHSTVIIPVEYIFEKQSRLYSFNYKNIFGIRYDVSINQYRQSRESRIAELKMKLGEAKDIDQFIPINPTYLSFEMFKSIFSTCVEPIFYSKDTRLNNIFGIMMNIYRSNLYVFEIWNANRNTMVQI